MSRAFIAGASPTTAKRRPFGLSCSEKRVRQDGRRARENDGIVGRVLRPAVRSIADLEEHVVDSVALEIAPAEGGERGPRLHRDDLRRALRHERGEVAASGAHLEHIGPFSSARAPAARAPRAWAATCARPRRSVSRDRRMRARGAARARIPPAARRTEDRARPDRAPPRCGSAAPPCWRGLVRSPWKGSDSSARAVVPLQLAGVLRRVALLPTPGERVPLNLMRVMPPKEAP